MGRWDGTDASVHESNVFTELLDENNNSADVYADSAYRWEQTLKKLEELGYGEHIQRKGCRNKALTSREKQGNRTPWKIRSRIERVFGVQVQRAGNLICQVIGFVRARVVIGLPNLAYNLQRYSMLMVSP